MDKHIPILNVGVPEQEQETAIILDMLLSFVVKLTISIDSSVNCIMERYSLYYFYCLQQYCC